MILFCASRSRCSERTGSAPRYSGAWPRSPQSSTLFLSRPGVTAETMLFSSADLAFADISLQAQAATLSG
jgi:hypothetical protein